MARIDTESGDLKPQRPLVQSRWLPGAGGSIGTPLRGCNTKAAKEKPRIRGSRYARNSAAESQRRWPATSATLLVSAELEETGHSGTGRHQQQRRRFRHRVRRIGVAWVVWVAAWSPT